MIEGQQVFLFLVCFKFRRMCLLCVCVLWFLLYYNCCFRLLNDWLFICLAFQLHFRVLSGNSANLVHINETNGRISLSSNLNTNVAIAANMEISVTGEFVVRPLFVKLVKLFFFSFVT